MPCTYTLKSFLKIDFARSLHNEFFRNITPLVRAQFKLYLFKHFARARLAATRCVQHLHHETNLPSDLM